MRANLSSCCIIVVALWLFILLHSETQGQSVKYVFTVYYEGLANPYNVAKSPTTDAVYMAEYDKDRIDKKSYLGFTVVAGTGTAGFNGDSILAKDAKLNNPGGIQEYNNELYIVDYGNNRLRKINTEGVLVTLAGTGSSSSSGDNGLAKSANLNGPWGVHVVPGGDIYIAEYVGNKVRKISASDNKIYLVAGNGGYDFTGDGGTATSAKLKSPWSVFYDSSTQNLYIADTDSNRIRKVSNGKISTIVGGGSSYTDGADSLSVALQKPTSVFISPANELFIAEADGGRIRKVNLSTMKTYTVASSLNTPTFAYVDVNSDLYIAERGSGKIRLGTASCDSGYQINSIGTVCNPLCNSQIGRAGCSNQGSCTSPSVCTCDTGYTTSDCSQPICNGKYGSSACGGSNQGTCTAPNTCQCKNGYSGSDCTDYYCSGVISSSASVCSGKGTCSAPDTCSCQSGYTGPNCQYPICNGIPSNSATVCNGGGTCTAPNTCQCFSNYTGSECQYTTCSGVASTASNVCSGRGSCVKYNTCTCSDNFFGSNCEFTQCYGVISNSASTCSSRGTCDGYNKCTCNSNYFGLDCSVTSCYGVWSNISSVCTASDRGTCNSFNNCTCKNSYYGSQCQDYDCFGVNKSNSSVCSGKGTCTAPNTCVCSDSSYSGLNCNAAVCFGISATDSGVCSGSRGACNSPNNCSCFANYFGAQCQITQCYGIDNTNTTYVCSGRGTCSDFNKCVCKDGYYGSNCQLSKCFGVLSNSSNVCSGHGTCLNTDSCNCDSNYSGSNCEITSCYGTSSTSSSVCSSHGSCSSYNNCTCSSTYSGQQCQDFSCFGVNKASAGVCSGHGTCTDIDTCSCTGNWVGGNCNLTTCYGVWNYNSSVCSGSGVCSSLNNCTCNPGYYGLNCDSFDCFGSVYTSSGICANNGSCTGPGVCSCTEGFSGSRCQYPICYGISGGSSSVCSGNGQCIDKNRCSCSSGWVETTCNVTTCSGKRNDNPLVCSSQGACTGPEKCTCNKDHTGTNCEFNVCYGKSQNDASVCSARGKCLKPGECTCDTGFRGTECQYYQIDFDEKLATLKPTLSSVLQYSYLFNGSCETLFESSDLPILGESPICLWDNSRMIIYLGFGSQLQTGNLIRVKNSNLSFFIDMSNSLSYTGTGITLKKQMTKVPASNALPLRPIVDSNYQSYTNFSSLVWSCLSCSSTLNDFLKSQQREYLYIPPSYLKSLSELYLQLAVSNFASNSKVASLSFTFSQTAAPNLDLVSDLNSNSQISCTGYDCIIETEPIGYGNNAGLYLGSYPEIKYNVYLSRFFNTDSSGTLGSGSTTGSILLIAKHTQSTTSNDYFIQYSFNAYESTLPVVLSARNPVYSPSSFIRFKATIFNQIVFVKTIQDTYYLWKLFKLDDSGQPKQMSTEVYIDLFYDQVTVTRQLEAGTYLMSVNAVAAYGSTLLNTTFTVLNTTDKLASISFSPVPSIVPISEDLVITATINGTKSSFEWIKTAGRIKPLCSLQFETTQPSENITQSELTITRDCLYEGEIYGFKVVANHSNGLSSSAEIQTQTDISPSIHCDFYSTSEDGSFIALDSTLLLTCRNGAKDTIKSYTVELHYNGERKFIISNTQKRNLYFRMPYLIEGSQLVVRALNFYNTEVIYRKNLTSTLSSSDKIQLFIDGYNSITTSETTTYYGVINSLNSLLTLFEYDNFDSLQNKNSLQTTLKSMLSLVSYLRNTGVNVDDKLTALLLPSVYRIHKYLDSINGTRSSDDWRVDDLVSWTSYFSESILNTLQYYYSSQWKFLIDQGHLNELEELIQLGSSMNSEKFVLVQVQYELLTDRLNGVTTKKSQIQLSNGVLLREKLDSVDALRSYTISLYYSNTNVTIQFPSDVADTLAFGDTYTDNSINSFVKVSTTSNSKIIGAMTSVNIQTQKFKELSVQNLTNTISISFTGSQYPAGNVTCKYYNSSSQEWMKDGVSTVISTSNNLVTVSCLTNHLTTFAIFKNDIIYIPGNSTVTSQNDPALAIALGIILPLLAIAIIIAIIIIVVILVLRYRKKKLNSEVSNASAIELRSENKRGLFDTDISDFPSEASTYFKHLNSSSMASSTISSTSSSNDAFSRYKDMIKIGEGAFGSVFKVTDSKNNNKVKAIKVIRYKSVEELNSMMKEGAQLMNINHPNILKVNDFFVEKDNLLCIDMDFYPQGDLSSLINQQEDCKEVHIKQIIYQMCNALNFIHNDLKLIHRDVKPSNIFIKFLNGNVIQTVLADFGLARDAKNSASMSFAGTPLYMSPELALGGKYYANTDEYSLGVTVYQLITKDNMTAISHLYMSKDAKEVQNLCRKRLKESGDYSDRLIDICLQMLEKDNCARPYAQDILENSYFNDIKKIR